MGNSCSCAENTGGPCSGAVDAWMHGCQDRELVGSSRLPGVFSGGSCSGDYLPEAILLGRNGGAQAFQMNVRRGPLAAQVSHGGSGQWLGVAGDQANVHGAVDHFHGKRGWIARSGHVNWEAAKKRSISTASADSVERRYHVLDEQLQGLLLLGMGQAVVGPEAEFVDAQFLVMADARNDFLGGADHGVLADILQLELRPLLELLFPPLGGGARGGGGRGLSGAGTGRGGGGRGGGGPRPRFPRFRKKVGPAAI